MDIRTIAGGFGYLESARWFDGSLWFSDIRDRVVYRMQPDGTRDVIAQVDGRPSGLGFAPDGGLMAVSMEDARLVRVGDGVVEVAVDLLPAAPRPNDMVMDRHGRAYVSQFGYDVFGGERPRRTRLALVHPAGEVTLVGDELTFPNGIGLLPDGSALIVAESFAEPNARLSAFDVLADGHLGPRRTYAEFGPPPANTPDGICVDAEGGVWVAFPAAGEFRRVDSFGVVTDRIAISPDGGNACVDCALGGDDGRTLFMLVADTDTARLANGWDSTARVDAVQVTIPGAGLS